MGLSGQAGFVPQQHPWSPLGAGSGPHSILRRWARREGFQVEGLRPSSFFPGTAPDATAQLTRPGTQAGISIVTVPCPRTRAWRQRRHVACSVCPPLPLSLGPCLGHSASPALPPSCRWTQVLCCPRALAHTILQPHSHSLPGLPSSCVRLLSLSAGSPHPRESGPRGVALIL